MRLLSSSLLTLLFTAAPAFANVLVTGPSNGQTVMSPVRFTATANTTTCSKGVAAMGVFIDNQPVHVATGTSVNADIPVAPGAHNAVIQEWDQCGGSTTASVPLTVTNQSGVWVSSPGNNTIVSGPVGFVASATTACAQGVAAMGIYVNDQLQYVSPGATLNKQLTLPQGAQNVVVQDWDYCGGYAKSPLALTVASSGSGFTNVQLDKWNSWGQQYPDWQDCNAGSCPGLSWVTTPAVTQSLTGLATATRFDISGTTPYSDVLWSDPVLGQGSTHGITDTARTLIPSLHNFSYDAYFYVSNPAVSQAVEFDVNMFLNGVGMTWGTECRMEAGNEWDYWDNVNLKWTPTGVPCNPIANGWNHVTVNVQRAADNTLIYQSITLNGYTANLNITSKPFTVPASWYGVTVNYQMDGDYKQTAYATWLDKFSFLYW